MKEQPEGVGVRVGRGLLIAAAFVALPGTRALIRGEVGPGLLLLVVPVVLAGIGLCLMSEKARLPVLIVGTVLATIGLVGVSMAVQPPALTGIVFAEESSPVRVIPNGMPTAFPSVDPEVIALMEAEPTSPRPTPNELAWVPPRAEMTSEQQAIYDEYARMFARYAPAVEKADAVAAKAQDVRRKYARMQRAYKRGEISYGVLSKQYDRQSDAWNRSFEMKDLPTDIGNEVVALRREMLLALTEPERDLT